MRRATLMLLVAAASGCGDDDTGGFPPFPCDGVTPFEGELRLGLEEVVTGLDNPGLAAWAPGDDRMYVLELYTGLIRIIENGEPLATPFLDVSAKITSGGEQGLLGLAFHPEYEDNGRFFVNYTDIDGNTMIEEYARSADRNVADPASGRRVFLTAQPAANHNGGHLAFGPDGLLYIGMGDGGGREDQFMNAQNPDSPLGKMLRIDVDVDGSEPELWAMGLRNPWRWSFDVATGDLYIGDVGQNLWEEIDVIHPDDPAPNLGWPCREGAHDFTADPARCPDPGATFVEPAHDYSRLDLGGSVTGGYVYRGCRMPGLHGTYFFAEFSQSWTSSFVYADGVVADVRRWDDADGTGDLTVPSPSSFGQDPQGELYIVSYGPGAGTGAVHRIVPLP